MQTFTMMFLTAFLLIGCWCAVTSAGSDDTPPSGIHILDGICINKRADRLVYRHKNDTHIYIAFDILKKGKVRVYTWKIIKAVKGTFISAMEESALPAVDFRKTVNRDHILGSSGKSNYKKFRNRLLRKMKRCDKKKKLCKIADIISVFVRLKMRKVFFSKKDDGSCEEE